MELTLAQKARLADMDDDLSNDFSCCFTPGAAMFARIEGLAAKEGMKRATLLRQLLREALENHEVA